MVEPHGSNFKSHYNKFCGCPNIQEIYGTIKALIRKFIIDNVLFIKAEVTDGHHLPRGVKIFRGAMRMKTAHM